MTSNISQQYRVLRLRGEGFEIQINILVETAATENDKTDFLLAKIHFEVLSVVPC